jgi:3-phosphoshikimate 1-carboxyvinyltransferase
MSFAVAGLLCGMEIEDTDCVATSFPNFFELLSRITEVTTDGD